MPRCLHSRSRSCHFGVNECEDGKLAASPATTSGTVIRAAVSIGIAADADALALSGDTCFRLSARIVARTAVVLVPQQVDANSAPGKPGSAPWVKAHPLAVAIRRRVRADVSAGATVLGIRAQKCACPVAVDGALDAVVD